MSALASLLVRDQMVSVRKIEEAIQRQVISGGELGTVLLEMGLVAENAMHAYRAALYGLLPATREEVMKVPREVIRLVPKEVAERHRMVPLAAEGHAVVVAVAQPLSSEEEQQLAFLLGYDLSQRIVADVRIAAALAHHYGVEIKPRLRRVADKLRKQEPGPVPYVKPPGERSDSEAPAALGADRGASPDTRPMNAVSDEAPGMNAPPAASVPAPTTRGSSRSTTQQFIRPPDASHAPSERGDGSVGVSRVIPVTPPPPRPAPGTGPTVPSIPSAPSAPHVAPASGSPPWSPSPPSMPAASVRPSAPARARASSPSGPTHKKLRGPLSTRRAVQLLEHADTRDEILDLFVRFARQFFDYTATFVVHEDVADGREAYGPGATVDDVRLLAVPLEVPGSFGAVCKTRTPGITRLDASELDRIVARDLGREGATPALLLPIAIRQRVVLLLYGDRDGEEFGLDDLPELLAVAPRVSEAFERLILRRKFRRRSDPPAEAPHRPEPPAGGVPSPGPDAATGATGPAGPSEEPSELDRPDTIPAPAPEPSDGSEERRYGPPVSSPPPARGEGSGPLPSSSISPPSAEAAEDRAQPTRRVRRTIMGLPTAAVPASATGERSVDVSPDPASETGAEPPAHRPEAFSTLRIPRSAPPPPELRAERDTFEDIPVDGFGGEDTSAVDGSVDPARGGASPAGSLEPGFDPFAEPSDGEEPPSSGVSGAQPGSYRQGEAPSDSFSEPSASSRWPEPSAADVASEQPSAGRAGPARDPRREAGDGPVSEVVRVGRHVRSAVDATRAPRGASRGGESDLPSAEPSVIVDMGDTIEHMVRDLTRSGPDEERAAVEALLAVGEAALPSLIQSFPGPLWFDRNQPHRRLPRGRDVSAVARALAAFGDRAASYVGSLLASHDPDTRFYATLLASELGSGELVAPLGDRVFDSDPGVRALVLDVLRLYRRHSTEQRKLFERLRSEVKVPRHDPEVRLVAIRALGALRDAAAVPILVEMLKEEEPRLLDAARRSLVVLTRQDLGDAHRKWVAWLDRNRERHRIEWLIDALASAEHELRAAAGDELKQLTQQYYGYHPSMPKRDRDVAQRKYREWWESEGYRRFTEPPGRA